MLRRRVLERAGHSASDWLNRRGLLAPRVSGLPGQRSQDQGRGGEQSESRQEPLHATPAPENRQVDESFGE
jgi:hypothetical protein